MPARSLTWMLAPEGGSDVDFLLPLVRRLLVEKCGASDHEVDVPNGIDLRSTPGYSRRPDRVAGVVSKVPGKWLLVVHADGGSNPATVRMRHVDPILDGLPAGCAGVAAVPVHAIEAWVLADATALAHVLDTDRAQLVSAGLPSRAKNLEAQPDPKVTLMTLVRAASAGSRRPRRFPFERLGERVSFTELRALPAFVTFEADLAAALRRLGLLR